MKSFIERQLLTYGYESIGAYAESLAPSSKYATLSPVILSISAISVVPIKIFGLTEYAFGALFMMMVVELISGVIASRIRKEPYSSTKSSRFILKVCQYLVVIAVTHLFADSYKVQGKEMGATIFEWMHIFLTVQIVQENIVSILENGAVISGKSKVHWISKLSDKINSFFS